jgi:pimeloyl-ACP methyl ester carboxylesterase
LLIALIQCGEGVAQIEVLGLLQRDAGGQCLGGEVAREALEQLERLIRPPARVQELRQRNGRIRPARLEFERAPERFLVAFLHQRVGLRRHESVEKALDRLRRLSADELGYDATVAERLNRRDSLNSEGARQRLVGVHIDLHQFDLAGARADSTLQQWGELPTRTAPIGPEVDDHGDLLRALDDCSFKVVLVDIHLSSDGRHQPMAEKAISTPDGVALAVDDTGVGTPVVLLHGLTATRRYVVMGSKALERSGHRVIAYDARGHGESSPAPSRDAYRYPELASDLVAVLDALEVDRAVLAGSSMGAHTLLWLALHSPERVGALVVITPAFDPETNDDPRRLAHWDALASGLREGGIDGFVAAYGLEKVPEAWRDTVGKVIRQRMALHEHPEAIADALHTVPRSHPFERIDELAAISVPTAVVASADDADPEHPQEVGEAYAAAIRGARLITDQPGHSPIAWQGSQLSRVIASVAERAAI